MTDHYKAYIAARSVGENLLLAYAAPVTEYASTFHEKRAAEELKRLANELGFELVKREAKREAKQSEAA